jgi:hypothetical protein
VSSHCLQLSLIILQERSLLSMLHSISLSTAGFNLGLSLCIILVCENFLIKEGDKETIVNLVDDEEM